MNKKKDPALLMYPDTWLTTTMLLSPEARGYLINLVMQDFSLSGLPNDLKKLAVLAVIPQGKFRSFKKYWETELKSFFTLNEEQKFVSNFNKNVVQQRKKYLSTQRKHGIIGRILQIFKRENNDELSCFKIKKICYTLSNDELLQIIESETNIKYFLSDCLSKFKNNHQINPMGSTPGDTPTLDPRLSLNEDEDGNKMKNIHTNENVDNISNQSPITDSPDQHSSPQHPPPQQSLQQKHIYYSDKFNSWLNEYGNKNCTYEAWLIWQKLTPDDHLKIMNHTNQFNQLKKELKFRPNADKYLTSKRWLDDLSEELKEMEKEKSETNGKMMPEELKKEFGI